MRRFDPCNGVVGSPALDQFWVVRSVVLPELSRMSQSAKHRLRYALLWPWCVLLLYCCFLVYRELVPLVPKAIDGIPSVKSFDEAVSGSPLSPLFNLVVLALFCWRIFKTAVLQGSPFPALIDFRTGRENGTAGGRSVRIGWIGRFPDTGDFWFGVVAKSHPSSDKLVRSRIEFLMIAIPYWRTLIVGGGRFYFRLMDHGARHSIFDKCVGAYGPVTDAWEAQIPEGHA